MNLWNKLFIVFFVLYIGLFASIVYIGRSKFNLEIFVGSAMFSLMSLSAIWAYVTERPMNMGTSTVEVDQDKIRLGILIMSFVFLAVSITSLYYAFIKI